MILKSYNLSLDCSKAQNESIEYKICSNNVLLMQDVFYLTHIITFKILQILIK